MLFFEYSFLFVFLPTALALHAVVPRRSRNLILFLLSATFYSFSSWTFLPILLLSVVVDFVAGKGIVRSTSSTQRRSWLLLSLFANLGALAFFKYIGLITTTLRTVLGPSVPVIMAALPVGISFYTFQSMSSTIDFYRGRTRPVASFWDFATYATKMSRLSL